jgi:PAS domain S-box-containing protein
MLHFNDPIEHSNDRQQYCNTAIDRLHAEVQLEEYAQRYQSLSHNIPGVIYQLCLAPDGKIYFPYISSSCRELFELEPATIIADAYTLIGIVHRDDLSSFNYSVQRSAEILQPVPWEGRAVFADGRIKWFKSAARPRREPDGTTIWDGVVLDITDRKSAELELLESRSRYEQLVNNLPGIIFQCQLDEEGKFSFLYLSPQFEILFGIPYQRLVQDISAFHQLMHPQEVGVLERSFQTSARMMRACFWEGRLFLPNGEVRWVRADAFPERREDEAIVWDGILMDISDRHATEIALQEKNQELELLNRELQRATKLKDAFLASMTHELRTPLNAIIGLSEALQGAGFDRIEPRQRKSIETIERSGKHLLSLINDILDLAKIGAGKLELDYNNVSIAQLVDFSLSVVTPQSAEKQIHIDFDLPLGLPRISADERRMRQILINLLANAIKFTPPHGRVSISAGLESLPVRGHRLRISVSDTGIGIAPENRSRLFQAFSQLDNNLNRKYEGTGLGLVLAKQLIESHEGTIDVESELDCGSCFSIYLPSHRLIFEPILSRQSNSGNLQTFPADSISLAPKILLAADDEARIGTTSSYLAAKGYEPLVARNCQETIEFARQHQPDAILVDFHTFAIDDELAAIEVVRQSHPLAATPIILLADLSIVSERDRALAAGATDFLTKPIKLSHLHQIIQQWLALDRHLN